MLDDLGLVAAVQSYAETRLEPCGTKVISHASITPQRLTPELEITLFRVAQEAISNIARHARARTARVGIDLYDDNHLVLRIEDDGEGFIPAKYLHPANSLRGIGLLGMRERVALAGGTLTIDSTPRRGTRIRVEIALNGRAP
jgi:two-component system sensor histidine kinase UhpB